MPEIAVIIAASVSVSKHLGIKMPEYIAEVDNGVIVLCSEDGERVELDAMFGADLMELEMAAIDAGVLPSRVDWSVVDA